MKILAVTDIHGSYKKVVEILDRELPDILIIGGDLTTSGTIKEVEDAVKQFFTHCKSIFCVAGNMDFPEHDELFYSLGISLNSRGVIIKNVGMFGVSGSPCSPLCTPYEIREEEIANRIVEGYLQIKNANIKILVSHTPPFRTKVDIIHSGIHVGSTAVREFIENKKPELVICGHIHESYGQDILDKTKIINCGPAFHGCYCIIEINGGNIIVNNKKF